MKCPLNSYNFLFYHFLFTERIRTFFLLIYYTYILSLFSTSFRSVSLIAAALGLGFRASIIQHRKLFNLYSISIDETHYSWFKKYLLVSLYWIPSFLLSFYCYLLFCNNFFIFLRSSGTFYYHFLNISSFGLSSSSSCSS